MKLQVVKGYTSLRAYVFIQDSSVTTGAGLTGLVYNSSGLVASYVRPGASRTAITLATQTVTGAFSSGGFVEVDATNMPGVYRLDIPDAALATGVDSVVVMLKGATNMVPCVLEIQLTSANLNDSVRGGMTALPNAAADAAGGLPISDAGGLDLDVRLGYLTADIAGLIGTPAGASVSADLAAIKGDTAAILLDTGTDGVVIPAATIAAIVDAVWDEATSGHSTAGTTGKALTDAGSAGDPWSTTLPGAYAAGTAGYILGTNLDVAITTRQIAGAVDLNADQTGVTIGTVQTLSGHTPQTGDSYARLGAPAGLSIAADLAANLAAIGGLNDLDSTAVQAAAAAALAAYDPPTYTEVATLVGGLNDLDGTAVQAAAAAAIIAYDPPTRTEATSDKAEILTILGTPAGASIAADIIALKAVADAILVDTGTTGVLIAGCANNAARDDLADAIGHRDLTISGTTLTVQNYAGTATLFTRAVGTDPAAEQVVSLT